jgi:sarcosine oxidase subunit gamma
MAETRLRPLPGRARFILRGDAAALPAIGAGFGVTPPDAPLASAVAGGRAALWLGPDEWLLLAEGGAPPPPAAPGASLIDISHRHLAYALEGPAAAPALNEGCPLDLDPAAFPPGACTRTLFGKVEILLWRRGEAAFEIEVARSFAAPLRALLEEALRDLEG